MSFIEICTNLMLVNPYEGSVWTVKCRVMDQLGARAGGGGASIWGRKNKMKVGKAPRDFTWSLGASLWERERDEMEWVESWNFHWININLFIPLSRIPPLSSHLPHLSDAAHRHSWLWSRRGNLHFTLWELHLLHITVNRAHTCRDKLSLTVVLR